MPAIFFGVLPQNYLFELVLGNYSSDHNILAIPVGINENRHLMECNSNCNRKAIAGGWNEYIQYWMKQQVETQ